MEIATTKGGRAIYAQTIMRKILITLLILMSLLASGCDKGVLEVTEEVFGEMPDAYISQSIEGDINNLDELREMHKHYRVNNTLFTETEAFNDFYSKLDEEEQLKFAKRSDMVTALWFAYNDKESGFDQFFIDEIKNYLTATKQAANTELNLSKELLEKDPVNTVKEYMDKSKIEIVEMFLPNALVSIDRWNYPIKTEYKYLVKGTVDGEPFEKEIVQTFYFGANLDEVEDIGKATLIIEGIE